jgi:hypothetical protein
MEKGSIKYDMIILLIIFNLWLIHEMIHHSSNFPTEIIQSTTNGHNRLQFLGLYKILVRHYAGSQQSGCKHINI